MKVLIIGGGGREHALAWKLAQSPRVAQVYVAPGNAGTAPRAGVAQRRDRRGRHRRRSWTSHARERIDLTIVGPEAPLVAGVADASRRAGLRCFGPRKLAARLEGSKASPRNSSGATAFPTAAYATFTQATFDAGMGPRAARAAGRQGRRPGGRQGRDHLRAPRRRSARRRRCSPAQFGAAGRRS